MQPASVNEPDSPEIVVSSARFALVRSLPLIASLVHCQSEAFRVRKAFSQDVNFWIRVYTEVNTNEGFLHDERNLARRSTTP